MKSKQKFQFKSNFFGKFLEMKYNKFLTNNILFDTIEKYIKYNSLYTSIFDTEYIIQQSQKNIHYISD